MPAATPPESARCRDTSVPASIAFGPDGRDRARPSRFDADRRGRMCGRHYRTGWLRKQEGLAPLRIDSWVPASAYARSAPARIRLNPDPTTITRSVRDQVCESGFG
jgi:hypothetical protein